jgi:hypothetical protein
MGDEARQGKPRFEPPPWEVEAFEELAAKRARQEAAARAAAIAPDEAEREPLPEAPVSDAAQKDVEVDGGAETRAVPVRSVTEPDSQAVQAMLQQLAREEASGNRTSKIVSWVASGITAVLGVSMFIGGIVVGGRAAGNSATVLGSVVLTVFGLGFVGMSVWVWVSANRVRGR